MSHEPLHVFVDSEIGCLRRVLIHSPDSGVGKVIPSKAQDWLFEDIVHLGSMRAKEYDLYVKILLYFLDSNRIQQNAYARHPLEAERSFYKPNHAHFHHSDKVIEFQQLLFEIIQKSDIRAQLVAAVCAHEKCSWDIQQRLLNSEPKELAKVLISGSFLSGELIFQPIPNLIFTRDIGIVIHDHILLNRAATLARARESLLGKYLFFSHPLFKPYQNKIIELSDSIHYFLLPEGENDVKKTTLEGGDIMMIAPRHLIIGISERTSAYAANQIIKAVFTRDLVDKVSVLKIPKKRAYMHIDTIFTQVKRDCWVMLGSLGRRKEPLGHEGTLDRLAESKPEEQLQILQFRRHSEKQPTEFAFLEDLLEDISHEDLHVNTKVKFIYSGGGEFPFDAREQWTDSCNLLALKEGVVIGYDRNEKTADAFSKAGFLVITAADLLTQLDQKPSLAEQISDTLILLPSSELSRARGGSHCMSLPLTRDAFRA